MLFCRSFAVFTAALSFSAVSQAAPAGSTDLFAKRASTADIMDTLTTLQTTIAPVLSAINSTISGGTASDATITPLTGELTSALKTAAGSLSTLSTRRSLSVSKRQSDDEIASTVASIVTDVTSTLDGLLGVASSVPTLSVLLIDVDASLNQVLVGLETLLAGVLNLVATLLSDVAGLLRSLAFGLTLASLGL